MLDAEYAQLAGRLMKATPPLSAGVRECIEHELTAGECFAALQDLIEGADEHGHPLPAQLVTDIRATLARETYAYYRAEIPDLLTVLDRIRQAA